MLNAKTMKPFISIIIPCRNEVKFIGRCLDSVISNDYPKERMEIIIVDGMSNDGTVEVIDKYVKGHAYIRLLHNERKIVPAALNIGINRAEGEIIIRMDAHNVYERDYVSKCVRYLLDNNVDNVGGIWVTLPSKDSLWCRSIAVALSHPFGVGNAYYRIGTKKSKYVDTLPFGCYKKSTLQDVGLFDEEMIRNQDDELNARIIKKGGKILLVPDIVSYYYARDSIRKIWNLFFQYGYFKPLAAKKIGAIPTWRQLIPVTYMLTLLIAGVLSILFNQALYYLIGIILFYYIISLIISIFISVKKRYVEYIITLPIVFATLHFSYGIGYLKGLIDFIALKKSMVDVPLTR